MTANYNTAVIIARNSQNINYNRFILKDFSICLLFYITRYRYGVKGHNKKLLFLKKGFLAMRYACVPCGYVYDPNIGDPDGGIETAPK